MNINFLSIENELFVQQILPLSSKILKNESAVFPLAAYFRQLQFSVGMKKKLASSLPFTSGLLSPIGFQLQMMMSPLLRGDVIYHSHRGMLV